MKKVFSYIIVSLLFLSLIIYPSFALIQDSVSWDGYPEWLNQYIVRGHIEIFSYQGKIPTAYFNGVTNSGMGFPASVTGVGYRKTDRVECDLQGSLPLITWDAFVIQ